MFLSARSNNSWTLQARYPATVVYRTNEFLPWNIRYNLRKFFTSATATMRPWRLWIYRAPVLRTEFSCWLTRLPRSAINRAFAVSTRVCYRSRRVQLTTVCRYVCPCAKDTRSFLSRGREGRGGGVPLNLSADGSPESPDGTSRLLDFRFLDFSFAVHR